MANVRLDANRLPKASVYDYTVPLVHRSGITVVDSSDPSDTSGAVDCDGYRQCRFDLTIGGTGCQGLDVQVLFWNSRQSVWGGGGSRRFAAMGRHALVADARGAIIFLKVIAFSGTSFTLDADYLLS